MCKAAVRFKRVTLMYQIKAPNKPTKHPSRLRDSQPERERWNERETETDPEKSKKTKQCRRVSERAITHAVSA